MRTLGFAALLLAPAVPALAQDSDTTAVFTLPGLVLDYRTEAPVADALVEIVELDRRVFADSAGRFAFTSLTEGRYNFVVRRLGYVTTRTKSMIRRGDAMIVRVVPKPIVLEGIRVVADGFEGRTNATGVASYVSGRAELLASAAPDLMQFLRQRYAITPVRNCLGRRLCLRVRGRPRAFVVYLDEMRLPSVPGIFDVYWPADFYRVEVYPALGQIHLFTPRYVERLARDGREPAPICIICSPPR